MGILYYDTNQYEFDSVVLAHLRVVITHQLRRHEASFSNWPRGVSQGSGRMSIWISPGVPVSFDAPELTKQQWHPEWIEEMIGAANTDSGVDVLGIPVEAPHRPGRMRIKL